MVDRQRGRGSTLCRLHARQIVRLDMAPTDGCDPEAWVNGRGEMIECDVVADPSLVTEMLRRKGLVKGEHRNDFGDPT